jgi:hypothetical protein
MQESFLHYIWQFQYFDRKDLVTTEGEQVSVFHPGYRNVHAGPDFSNARIRIGAIEWIGSVEIHIQSSGWNAHKHSSDDAYENVVLHVVWKNDTGIVRKDNSSLPTIELKNKVDEDLLLKYNKLFNNPETIPCAASVGNVRELTRLSMMEKALMQRLEKKTSEILTRLRGNNNDWEETCYQMLCRNFGFKVNTDPFLQLAHSLPYKALMKHADHIHQVEALLFGQAGFLDENIADDYFGILKREYNTLGHKFDLKDRRLNKSQWRFLRLRPANFPTIRIAQLAGLLASQKNIFSRFVTALTYSDLEKLFLNEQSDYWKHHYLFAGEFKNDIPALGKMSADNIMINTVVPLMVAYGKSKDDQELVDRAIAILQSIPSESNMITKAWDQLNISCATAFDSQALIELHNSFCLRRKCLDCSIGSSLVKPSAV